MHNLWFENNFEYVEGIKGFDRDWEIVRDDFGLRVQSGRVRLGSLG